MFRDRGRGACLRVALLSFVYGAALACGESGNGPSLSSADAGAAGDQAVPPGAGGPSAGAPNGAGGDGQGATGEAGAPHDAAGAGPSAGAGAPHEAGSGGSGLSQAGAPAEGGAGGEPAASCIDQDGDGYGAGELCAGPDCDDESPLVNPAMLELADDARDNDCQDGDLKAAAGVGYYVDANDAACSDGNDAVGTQAKPYCSVAMAMLRAYQATPASDPVGRSLFVAQGTYSTTTGTPRSMRVYGGYDASDWSYDPQQNVTILGGADDLKVLDGYAVYSSWLSVNVDANAVIQGFHIQGGKRPGQPIFAVEINSSGRVLLYDNVIAAGEGYQTLAVSIKGETQSDPSTSDVWLIENRISAGTPSDSSNYGVNNLGSAVLWGNVIDMGQGRQGSFGAAVQNYGVMTLVNNVLNGGSYGASTSASYGFINAKADGLPEPGVAHAYHNVIFGGAGTSYSIGVSNNAELTLVSNVIADRTPGPLPVAKQPSTSATPVSSGFAASTVLLNNALFQLIYSDEAPQSVVSRDLLQYASQQAYTIDDLALVNACEWFGCAQAGGNIAPSPGFFDHSDFHLTSGSVLLDQGAEVSGAVIRGLSNLDIDGELRDISLRDIGIDERHE